MKIIGLDGKTYTWNPIHYVVDVFEENQSSLHKKAYQILKSTYPNETIYQEVMLAGTKTKSRSTILRADFFIPTQKLVVEVHGEQHFKFNNWFYENKIDFYKAQGRDRDKKEWCEINGFRLVELLPKESEKEWTKKIART